MFPSRLCRIKVYSQERKVNTEGCTPAVTSQHTYISRLPDRWTLLPLYSSRLAVSACFQFLVCSFILQSKISLKESKKNYSFCFSATVETEKVFFIFRERLALEVERLQI